MSKDTQNPQDPDDVPDVDYNRRDPEDDDLLATVTITDAQGNIIHQPRIKPDIGTFDSEGNEIVGYAHGSQYVPPKINTQE